MIDWSKAPEGAQFYSFERFRKHSGAEEHFFYGGEWCNGVYDQIKRHEKDSCDFETRPIQIGDVYEVVDANNSFLYDKYKNGDRFTVSTKSDSGLSYFDEYDLTINKNDILNGYIRLVSTANPKQEETYMYGDMADLKPAKEAYKLYEKYSKECDSVPNNDQFLKNRKEVLRGKCSIPFVTTQNTAAHEALDRIVEIESSIQALLSERLELENLIYDVIER